MNIVELEKLCNKYHEKTLSSYYVEVNNQMIPRWDYYNGQRRIACAAINYGGLIFTGVRHHSADMNLSINLVNGDLIKEWMEYKKAIPIQGFVDNYGLFLTRTEAWSIAVKAKQILLNVYNKRKAKVYTDYSELPKVDKLYSEDYV